MELWDTHAHLDFDDFKHDLDQVIKKAQRYQIKKIITIGAGRNLDSAYAAVRLAKTYKNIYPTIGVHPHDVDNVKSNYLQELKKLSSFNQIIAIGEIGLDYYKEFSPKDTQKTALEKLLSLAQEKELPTIIHCRNAHDDMLEILKSQEKRLGGIIHCFSGNINQAKKYLDLGFYLGIGGIITFEKKGRLKEIVKKISLKYIVLETDSPFLAPHPYRGKRNEPWMITCIAQTLAQLFETSIEQVAKITTENVHTLFKLKIKN
jgi:TatD DNase family protein